MKFTELFSILIQIAGSLSFLLFGMKMMSDGIQKSAGERLKSALHFMAGNRFTGLLTGCFLTMLIQSSGATTVMVVSFVNAGLLTLSQSISVILGANIGTTITAWVVACFGFNFKISSFAVPIFGLGYFLSMKRFRKEGIGHAVMGFALLFIALGWLSEIVSKSAGSMGFLVDIQSKGAASYPLAALIGIAFTALIHSSSAMTAIVITMANRGVLTWEFSAAIVIGSNIGSTIDSIMASFGATPGAKRTALVHVLFNCVTAVVALAFIEPFTVLVDAIVPGPVNEGIEYHIAMLHTVFNILGTSIFVPFVGHIARLTEFLVKEEKNAVPSVYRLDFPEKAASESPTIPLVAVQHEVARMADIAVQMFDRLQYGFSDRSGRFLVDHYDNLVKEEDFLDQMQEQITHYLLRCEALDLDEIQRSNINVLISITAELESMSDDCMSIGVCVKKMTEKQYVYQKEDFDRLLPYLELSRQLLLFVYKNINHPLNRDQLQFAHDIEDSIDKERKSLKKVARKRLEGGADVKAELLYMDLTKEIEKIGDRCFSIAEQLYQMK